MNDIYFHLYKCIFPSFLIWTQSCIWNLAPEMFSISFEKNKILFLFTIKIKHILCFGYFTTLIILCRRLTVPPTSARAATGLQTSTQCVKRNEEEQVICMFPHSTVISPIKMRECEMIYCWWHSAKLSKCPQVSLLVFDITSTHQKRWDAVSNVSNLSFVNKLCLPRTILQSVPEPLWYYSL